MYVCVYLFRFTRATHDVFMKAAFIFLLRLKSSGLKVTGRKRRALFVLCETDSQTDGNVARDSYRGIGKGAREVFARRH